MEWLNFFLVNLCVFTFYIILILKFPIQISCNLSRLFLFTVPQYLYPLTGGRRVVGRNESHSVLFTYYLMRNICPYLKLPVSTTTSRNLCRIFISVVPVPKDLIQKPEVVEILLNKDEYICYPSCNLFSFRWKSFFF